MAVTGRAPLAALLGTVLMLVLRTWAGLILINGLLVLAIATDLTLAAGVRQLRFSRSGDSRIRLGEAGTVYLNIDNPGRRRLRAVVRDSWPPSLGASGRASVTVPPRGHGVVMTSFVPERRGDKSAVKVTVRSAGPLGLAARQASRQVPWTIRVLPAFLSRKHLPAALAVLRQLDGQRRSLVRGQGTEFDSLREYVIGDDVRSIDWRSTARRAEVVVRTWRPERDRRVIIALDTGRTSAGRVAGVPRLDTYLDAALLLAAVATRASDRVDLVAVDRQVRASVVGASRTELLARLTDAMAGIEPALADSDASLMVSMLLGISRQRCLVVLMTDLSSPALELTLLPRIPALAARHRLMVAAVADPRVSQLAAGRDDAGSVYQAAAAERAHADRIKVAMLLRRQGVDVLDASPDQLPPTVADAYLRLKAAGQL